jgi:hypothetical protein
MTADAGKRCRQKVQAKGAGKRCRQKVQAKGAGNAASPQSRRNSKAEERYKLRKLEIT